VRNFQARNFLRAMKKGDAILYYHSVSEKQVVGICKVVREAYPDPTAKEGDWSCVDLAPSKPLRQPVPLAFLKSDRIAKGMPLIRQSRLSVLPLTKAQFDRVLELARRAPASHGLPAKARK
jgi:predicted RNA-binding protein with PUA-like domain